MTDTTEVLPGPGAATVPRRAEGIELIGEMGHSGFREPPCLVRRSDGQTLQLTGLLYRVLEAIDGERDHAAIAAEVSEKIGKRASADDVAFLVEEKLRPLGVLVQPDGSEPELRKANPLLALRLRVVVSNEETTRRLTTPFAALFHPAVVAVVLAAFVAAVGWLLLSHGLAAGTRQVLYSPGLLVLVFALTALSAGFHEFGHAAACRYGGATPGVMGAGIYLVWPAFYTDVTDSYRLDRRGRLRTDLGGLYFNCVFSLATIAAWAVSGWDALLLLVPLQLMQMAHQLLPFVRLDGYYLLADITGVPDLFARIKPVLRSAVPGTDEDERVTVLKPWVRVVVTAWVLLVVPILLGSLVMAVVTLPRVVATAWDSLGLQWQAMGDAWGRGAPLEVLARLLSVGALLLPVASTAYLLSRIAGRSGRAVLRRVTSVPGRLVLGLVAGALVAGAAWLWWPNGEYRPLQPGERGTITDAVEAVGAVPTGRPGLTEERQAELDGAPFRSEPEVGEPAGAEAPATTTTTSTTSSTTTSTTEAPAPTTTTTVRRTTTTTAATAAEPPATTTSTTEAPTTTTTAPTQEAPAP